MPIVVWDPLLRLFHWTLLTFFVLAYCTEGGWREMHSHAGYTVTLLIGFRLVWGVIGAPHARFRDFVRSPRAVGRYLRLFARRRAQPCRGHDPAGAVMILALLALLLLTTATGMVLYGMEGNGPLAGTFVQQWPGGSVETVHELLADVTAGLVLLHIAGVLVTSWAHGQNLIKAMITGRKNSHG